MIVLAGLLVGAGLVALARIRERILAPDTDERLKSALWLAWLGVAVVTLGAFFGVLYRAARWSDSEALMSAGLLVVAGALSAAVVHALIPSTRTRNPGPPL
jgi:hypothetical protein